jgi:N-acetylglucosaminyldiphosphoundecaprenol N-acetyl-beta-D-mannosaminyltransferase
MSESSTLSPSAIPLAVPARNRFRVLGIPVDAVQIPDVIAILERWIRERSATHYVAVTGMHGVMEAQQDRAFKTVLETADLVVPDGTPLARLGRVHGYPLRRRVYGPELMMTFCEQTGSKYRHFYYGGAEGVADHLAQTLHEKFGVVTAGTYCPPFRPLTPEEDRDVVQRIEASGADVVWVGLSTPKQEKWMYAHRDTVRVPVMLGVGAAFDLNTGRLTQAPRWMREHGLEWLYRLLAEPKRLWRRYILLGSRFVVFAALELMGLRKFN